MQNVERWIEDLMERRLPGEEWRPDINSAFARFQRARLSKPPRSRAWLPVVVGALAGTASLAALPAGRTLAQRCVSACVAESSSLRQLFTESRSGSVPTNVFVKPGGRAMAPDFTLSDAFGRAVKLSDFRGTVVLLNFWATWCVPCRAEVPSLVDFQQAYGDRGVQVIGVSVDEDGWKSVKPFIEARHVNYPVMIGNADVARAFGGIESVPMTLIIDRSGRIAATHRGLYEKDEYESDVRAVLNE